jgi:hypothetical protein
LGSGGSAGGAGDICRLPVEVGPCEAEILRYAFDAKTGTCLLFTYGGCEGNANNFETIDECYETCGGSGEIDPTSCSRSSECAVIDRGCCPGCGQDGYSLVAVNMSQAGAYTEALACDVAACELCVGPEISAPRAWFGATCSAGRCVLFDTRESPATACDLDADCQLRMGAGCCEACGEDPANVIAYDRDGILLDQICGENPGNCPDCAAIYPPEVEAFCDAGRCAVLSTLAGD